MNEFEVSQLNALYETKDALDEIRQALDRLATVQQQSRSSVQLARNARGEMQWEVKVYVGTTEEELDRAREQAARVYAALSAEHADGKASS